MGFSVGGWDFGFVVDLVVLPCPGDSLFIRPTHDTFFLPRLLVLPFERQCRGEQGFCQGGACRTRLVGRLGVGACVIGGDAGSLSWCMDMDMIMD